MQVRDKVQKEFGKFAAIHVVSFAELYGGKICAALDRQHPRDFFDIKLLLDYEGITTEMWYSFLVSLLSHYKPVNELLNPVLKDQESAFENQFTGMTNIEFTYKDKWVNQSEKDLNSLIKDNPGKHHKMVRRLELVLNTY